MSFQPQLIKNIYTHPSRDLHEEKMRTNSPHILQNITRPRLYNVQCYMWTKRTTMFHKIFHLLNHIVPICLTRQNSAIPILKYEYDTFIIGFIVKPSKKYLEIAPKTYYIILK